MAPALHCAAQRRLNSLGRQFARFGGATLPGTSDKVPPLCKLCSPNGCVQSRAEQSRGGRGSAKLIEEFIHFNSLASPHFPCSAVHHSWPAAAAALKCSRPITRRSASLRQRAANCACARGLHYLGRTLGEIHYLFWPSRAQKWLAFVCAVRFRRASAQKSCV